jgi:hypothetical protein
MKYGRHLWPLAFGVLSAIGLHAQTTGWLGSAEPVSVERGAKANWKVAARTTAIEAANLFVIAKAVGASAHIDLTPVISLKDDSLELDLALINVPAGKYEIEISHIGLGGAIQELDRTILVVTAPSAGVDGKAAADAKIEPTTSKFEFKPKLDIGMRGQLFERRNADAGLSTRSSYKDLTLEGGFETLNSAEDWEVKSSFSFSGNSNVNEAVQYGNKGQDASRIDLTNYLVEGGFGSTRFGVGNINVSTHPLLVQGISNRGASLAGKLPMGFDLNASIQNGGGVQAGIDNIFGISQPSNMFKQVGVGIDLDQERPGKARFDFTRLSASQRVGTLASGGDAIEKSEGHGLRFSGRDNDGRGRLELSVASSVQTPAGSPTVNQGYAWTAEVGYDLLKDWAWRPELPVSFNTALRIEHSSPVYRSLGSSFGSNFRQQVGLFNLKVGPSQLQGQIVRRYDNVGADHAYLRNKLDSWSLNGSIPLDQFVKAWQGKQEPPASVSANETDEEKAARTKLAEEANKPNPFWPALTYQRKSVLGYGDLAFIPTGYTSDDLPMVHVLEQAIGLRWAFERAQIGIKRARVEQDNRQVGHETEDVTDNKWGYSLDYKASETLTLGASQDLSNNMRYVSGIVADQFQTKVSATYNMTPDTTILAEVNRTLARDTTTALNNLRGYQVQWTTKFKTPAFGMMTETPGQFYFRYVGSNGFTASSTSAAVTPITYAVQFGVTFSIF